MTMKLTEYIREKDVLEQWPMSKATLIRARKNGLPFVRLGAYICYKPNDLESHFCQACFRFSIDGGCCVLLGLAVFTLNSFYVDEKFCK